MKTSLLMAREDVPDDDGLRVILSVHQRAERYQVSFTRREVDELHALVAEPLNLLELV